MCGIVALLSSFKNGFSPKEADAFRDMLFVDTMRGWDSTGVFGVNRFNNVKILKEASHGADFIGTKEFQSFRQQMIQNGTVAVGHNRSATRGTVNDKNAHPFWVDDKIILVQNGTYYGDHKHLKNTEVDTEALTHVISEEPDISKALQKINAAYALVWYNTETKKLHIIRNTQRPLHTAVSACGTTFYASEPETILWAATRNGFELKDKPYMIKDGNLVQYEILEDGETKMTQETIDHNYKYVAPTVSQHQESFPFRGHGYSALYEDVDEVGLHVPVFGNLDTPVQRPAHIARLPHFVRPGDVNIRITDYMLANPADFAMPQAEAIQWVSKIRRQCQGSQLNVLLELVDYIPCNNHKDCTAFNVYGTFVTPDSPDGPQPVAYWLVQGTTEAEVMEMVTKKVFYRGDIGGAIDTTWIDSSGVRHSIVTSYVTNAKEEPTQVYELH